MLSVHGVSRRYGDVVALADVSFEAARGEIVGLLGANGAGKSTLLRTLAGLQAPDAGTIRISGVDLLEQPIEARRHLGYAAEEPTFYEELSAHEYLAFVSAVRGLEPSAARARAEVLLEELDLARRADEPVQRYSHGMRKKLSFVAAVLHQPGALLCDEALEGFDAAAALAAKDTVRAMAKAGTAVLFSSHVTETIERLCDRVIVLHHGRLSLTLGRSEWGDPVSGPSPLERQFLSIARGTPRADAAPPRSPE